MPFKFEAKYGLLTYAQCGDALDPHSIVCMLAELGAECIVGREVHADGGIHLHAFFMFERKFATRNERVFDVGDRHPNIVRGYGTPEKGWDYATKDGDVVGGGLERPSGERLLSTGDKWSRIIAAETRDDFFRLAAELDPKSLCVSFTSLRTYADWRYREDPEPYSHPRGISFCEEGTRELDEWVSRNLDPMQVGESYTYPGVLPPTRGQAPRPQVEPGWQKPPGTVR